MLRVFITGSSSGLGLMAGQLLISQGHSVILHARDLVRANTTRNTAHGAEAVVTGDLSRISEMKSVARQINQLGPLDAVIHNVGVGYREPHRIETEDGLPHVFAINVMASYVLTALIERPPRLVYISSRIHHSADPNLGDILWKNRTWLSTQAYAESKLYDVLLAFAIARRWPSVCSNAVEPGWVPTRMGGPDAPDDLSKAHVTQAWLAVSNEPLAHSTGNYFYHQALHHPNPIVADDDIQDELLDICARLSNIEMPN